MHIHTTHEHADAALARKMRVTKDKEDVEEGGGSVKITGQLGEVMTESVSIAHTVARKFLRTVRVFVWVASVRGIHFIFAHA